MVSYRDRSMCGDCASEYAKIFDGKLNREDRRRKKHHNPLFEMFQNGWRTEEIVNGWEMLEIPEWMRLAYDTAYESYKAQWDFFFEEVRKIKNERLGTSDD